MRTKSKSFIILLAAVGMLVLIFDSKLAAEGALQGIELCVYTVIPSMFPLLVMSSVIRENANSIPLRWIRPIEQFCHIPEGAGFLFVIGIIGGFPVAAICLEECCHNKNLSQKTAARMLAFCNNCGPAFIFGITSALFTNPLIPWCLWAIQICSALLTARIIPSRQCTNAFTFNTKPKGLSQLIVSAVKSMATICAWIVLFRVIIQFMEQWLLWSFPVFAKVLISGLLELTNGCVQLSALRNNAIRFVIASVLLSAGGLCVAMQTISAVQSFSCGYYWLGKCLQTIIAALLSIMLVEILFYHRILFALMICVVAVFLLLAVKSILRKNRTGNQQWNNV